MDPTRQFAARHGPQNHCQSCRQPPGIAWGLPTSSRLLVREGRSGAFRPQKEAPAIPNQLEPQSWPQQYYPILCQLISEDVMFIRGCHWDLWAATPRVRGGKRAGPAPLCPGAWTASWLAASPPRSLGRTGCAEGLGHGFRTSIVALEANGSTDCLTCPFDFFREC